MQLVELLDKIDETAPVGCKMCVHMATHGNCDGCLGPIGADPYEFNNFKPGNWLRALQAAEASGERNIVIGGQGEAEVNALWDVDKTYEHLCYVSEQCGYYTESPHNAEDETGLRRTRMKINTSEGCFELRWKCGGAFEGIDRLGRDGGRVVSWPHFG